MENSDLPLNTYFQSENALQDQSEQFRLLDLPAELRLRILEELLGTAQVIASLDIDGQMRIEDVHEDDDRKEWPSGWDETWGIRRYRRVLPSIALTSHLMLHETRSILEDTTYYEFTATGPHESAEDTESISAMLPSIKHVTLVVGIVKFFEDHLPLLGPKWLAAWMAWFIKLASTQAPRLNNLNLDFTLTHIDNASSFALDVFLETHPVFLLFECIIDVLATSSIPRLTRLKTLDFGVSYEPGRLPYAHDFTENLFPSFVNALEAAENKRLIHLKHPALEQQCTHYGLPLPCLYGLNPHRPFRENKVRWDEQGLPPQGPWAEGTGLFEGEDLLW
ncbi:hypothetical protein BDV97DRAFT_61722 [Delphinella strobiligena]|nr:hypothetical protein BDV97DRAFT_61722 [Delphinella strobiligena]